MEYIRKQRWANYSSPKCKEYLRNVKKFLNFGTKKMEHTGLEPVTSTLPVWRAPNCANAPCTLL